MKHERTLIIVKPDALQRNILGEVVWRFERKGLKIVGLKMVALSDALLDEHYGHHREKPFFEGLKKYMKKSPVVVMILEGLEAVKVARLISGATSGREADVGTIRGDLAMSMQANIVHASDSPAAAEKEISRFFGEGEIFDYRKIDFEELYAEDER